MGILINETTKEERRLIVEEAIGNISGSCDGCYSRLFVASIGKNIWGQQI